MAVICVLSHPPVLTNLVESVDYQFPDYITLRIVNTTIKNIEKKALEHDKDVDVFMCGGINASRCMRLNLSAKFVNIDVTGIDLMFAMSKAILFGNNIAIITYGSSIESLKYVKNIFSFTIHEYVYTDPDELDGIFKDILSKGINAVIGSSIILQYAELYHLEGVFIYSPDGIIRALDRAVSIIESTLEERKKAEELKTILDCTYSGVMAVDHEGIIKVFNPVAAKIAGVSADKALGRRASQVISDTRLEHVIKKKEGEYNQIQMLNGTPVLTNRVPVVIDQAIVGAVATFQDFSSIHQARDKINNKNSDKGFVAHTNVAHILGESAPMRSAKEKAMSFAFRDSTVLITGATGTGKELFASAIHNASARKSGPFVAVNCSAFHESLLESELFGYAEGAFTGAVKNGRAGLFELADGGTLFLDEIGDFPLHFQARLLRVLEERRVMRLGGDRVMQLDIRVIAATNRNMFEMIESGRFRHDLYYRLNVLSLHLPALEERMRDVPALIEHFCAQMHVDINKKMIANITNVLLGSAYHWPGNVRELRNVIERFAAQCKHASGACAVMREVFIDYLRTAGMSPHESDAIALALSRVGGSKTKAAKELGISRTTLWRKSKQQDTGGQME